MVEKYFHFSFMSNISALKGGYHISIEEEQGWERWSTVIRTYFWEWGQCDDDRHFEGNNCLFLFEYVVTKKTRCSDTLTMDQMRIH